MPPKNSLLERIDSYILILDAAGVDAETRLEARYRLNELVDEATKRGLRARLPITKIRGLLK